MRYWAADEWRLNCSYDAYMYYTHTHTHTRSTSLSLMRWRWSNSLGSLQPLAETNLPRLALGVLYFCFCHKASDVPCAPQIVCACSHKAKISHQWLTNSSAPLQTETISAIVPSFFFFHSRHCTQRAVKWAVRRDSHVLHKNFPQLTKPEKLVCVTT